MGAGATWTCTSRSHADNRYRDGAFASHTHSSLSDPPSLSPLSFSLFPSPSPSQVYCTRAVCADSDPVMWNEDCTFTMDKHTSERV